MTHIALAFLAATLTPFTLTGLYLYVRDAVRGQQ